MLFLPRRNGDGPTTCVDEPETEVILIIKGAIFLALDGPVLVHTPALLATVFVIDHGHILLPQEGLATTLLHQRERRSARKNHQGSQKNMTRVRSRDPVLLVTEVTAMMLIMVPMRGRQHLTILRHQREWKSAGQNHRGRQKIMMRIRSRDLIPTLTEMTAGKLAMITMGWFCSHCAAKCG